MLQLQRSRTSFRGTPGFTERKDLPEEPELRRTDKVKKAESDPKLTRNTRKTQQNTRQHPCSTAYQIEHGSSRGNIPDIYQNNSFLHISVVIIDPLSSDNSFLILVILYHI